MRIIYCGKLSHNVAYAMAAIHIGLYKKELPCFNEILKQWELCFLWGSKKGNLIYMGLDEELREVWIIGRGNHGSMVQKVYKGIDTIYNLPNENYFIHVDTWEGLIPHMMSLLFRYPPIKNIGGRIFSYWFKRNYNKWINKVGIEKRKLAGEERTNERLGI